MCIYVHAGARRLLKQHFQIPQVMSGDQNSRIIPDADIYFCDLGISVGVGVCLVQQSHSLHAILTCLQSKRDQVFCRKRVVKRFCKRGLDKTIHFLIILQKSIGVLGIRRKSLQTVGDKFSQRSYIFVFRCQHANGDGF